ncbi:MAG: hypothetical protein HZB26_00855, partial [Candidatus Hydrogenedentes bacterium]|nr:hypothetical protein [Candidatus Hydrogenedentota bacterium]
MDRSEPNPGRLTDFERAICYYTLPATDSRVTTGLVLTFALILFEALAALTYGLLQPDHFHNVYTVVGTWSLGVMIVFGLVVFTGRALANEVRRRRTLALAQRMPEPGDLDDDSIPDPFARHKLLRIAQGSATPIACTDNDGLLHYTIEAEPSSGWTNIKNAEGVEHLRINVRKTNTSFSLTEDETPSQTDVYAGAELVGTIQRHFSFK